MKPNLFAFDGTKGRHPHAVQLSLPDDERAKFDALPRGRSNQFVIVTDINGEQWKLKRASCGLNCYCAARAFKFA